MIGVNTADSNDAKAAIGGKWADGYQKQFLVFQLTETYAIDRLMLGGTSDADYSKYQGFLRTVRSVPV